MTYVDPKKRITAKSCLKHAFFESGNDEQYIEVNNLKQVGKFKKKKDDVNSFVVNSGVINGKMNTVNDCS